LSDLSRADVLTRAADTFLAASALLDEVRLRIWDVQGLTVVQLRLLWQLYENEGMGNAELAHRMLLSRPSVSNLLHLLEERGFVSRQTSSKDRRHINVVLEPNHLFGRYVSEPPPLARKPSAQRNDREGFCGGQTGSATRAFGAILPLCTQFCRI
jgi:MarR family